MGFGSVPKFDSKPNNTYCIPTIQTMCKIWFSSNKPVLSVEMNTPVNLLFFVIDHVLGKIIFCVLYSRVYIVFQTVAYRSTLGYIDQLLSNLNERDIIIFISKFDIHFHIPTYIILTLL